MVQAEVEKGNMGRCGLFRLKMGRYGKGKYCQE